YIDDAIDEDYKCFYDYYDKFLVCDFLIHKLPFEQEQINFFKAIKESTRTKIYISNEMNIKAVDPLLHINIGISIPAVNSYLKKDRIIKKGLEVLAKYENAIVLFSGGMFSKVLIKELSLIYPKHTYIDIGSTFDGIFKVSR